MSGRSVREDDTARTNSAPGKCLWYQGGEREERREAHGGIGRWEV